LRRLGEAVHRAVSQLSFFSAISAALARGRVVAS
jgi:hypothetical protein